MTVNVSPRMIHIGCSGWNYWHWRDTFYPDGLRAKDWFAFHAEQSDTVDRIIETDSFAPLRLSRQSLP